MSVNWRSYRAPVIEAAQYLSQGLLWGALAGFLVAGVGGRLAMLLLRLTSDPALAGTKTDDGFTIGAITPDTLFLLLLGTLAGAMGGGAYALIRGWIPPRMRLGAAAVLAAIGVGALTIEPHGIDFTLVEPQTLALALFIALPAVYGLGGAWLIERAYARGFRLPAAVALVVTFLPFLGQGPAAAVPIMVAVLLMAGNRDGAVSGIARAPLVTWAARAALAALLLLASQALYRDVTAVLA